MAKVIAGMAMSLDGFVADRDGGLGRLFPDLLALRETDALKTAIRETGAVVMGRRAYDMGQGDYTDYEFQTPIFVLTHHPPEVPAKGQNERLRFTFVTDGVESVIRQAREAAGERDVQVIGGASTIAQVLQAGLADEFGVDIVGVFLGEGLRPFRGSALSGVRLEQTRITPGPNRTEIRYRVVKE